MFRKRKRENHRERLPEQLPEHQPVLMPSCDRMTDEGRLLRDRMDALRPHSDLKCWR